MSDHDSQAYKETDCEVSVYEGSWATCDMGSEEEEKEEENAK